jgi:phosphoglycolate phosphatase
MNAPSDAPRSGPAGLFHLGAFEAFLFDFDGTLAVLNIDFAAMRRGVDELLRRRGVDPRGLHEQYVLERIDEGAGRLAAGAEAFRRDAESALLEVEMAAAREGSLLPGVRPLLKGLMDAGLRVAVLTRNCRQAVLRVAPDLEAHCHAFVPRDGLRHVKPHPEQLELCLDLLGVAPMRAVMVGDHILDVRSGQGAGLRTVGVLTGSGSREALMEAGADLVLEDVTRLGPLLGLGRGVGRTRDGRWAGRCGTP